MCEPETQTLLSFWINKDRVDREWFFLPFTGYESERAAPLRSLMEVIGSQNSRSPRTADTAACKRSIMADPERSEPEQTPSYPPLPELTPGYEADDAIADHWKLHDRCDNVNIITSKLLESGQAALESTVPPGEDDPKSKHIDTEVYNHAVDKDSLDAAASSTVRGLPSQSASRYSIGGMEKAPKELPQVVKGSSKRFNAQLEELENMVMQLESREAGDTLGHNALDSQTYGGTHYNHVAQLEAHNQKLRRDNAYMRGVLCEEREHRIEDIRDHIMDLENIPHDPKKPRFPNERIEKLKKRVDRLEEELMKDWCNCGKLEAEKSDKPASRQ